MKHVEQDENGLVKEKKQLTGRKKGLYVTVVLVILVILVSAVCVVGVKMKQNGDNSTKEDETSQNASLTAYGEISQEELIEYLKTTIVRIEIKVPNSAGGENTMAGSGVIIDITEDHIDIATARHVVEQTANPLICFNDGNTAYGSVLAYGKESDVAFVRVTPDNRMEEDGATISKAKCADNDAYEALLTDEEVILIGSSSKVAGNVEQGLLKEKEQFIELFQNHMLLCEASVSGGMSGGGTFGSDGRLIGVIVGTNGTDAVSVAVTDVMAEYRSILL